MKKVLCKVGTACPVAGVLSLFSQPCKSLSGWCFVKAALAWWDGQLPVAGVLQHLNPLLLPNNFLGFPFGPEDTRQIFVAEARSCLNVTSMLVKKTLTKPTSKCFLENPTSRSLPSANQWDAPLCVREHTGIDGTHLG